MDSRSLSSDSFTDSSKTAPIQNWQGYLDKFEQGANEKGFAVYLAKLTANRRKTKLQVTLTQFAPLHIIELIGDFARAALLACVQLPPAEVEPALARIAHAANTVRYGQTLPGKPTAEEREAYEQVKQFFPEQLGICSVVLKEVFRCYANGDYAVTEDANEVLRAARDLAEAGDSAAALALVGRAGAVALRTQIFWPGWPQEGNRSFHGWASVLHTSLELLQQEMPLADVETERLRPERIVASFAAPIPGKPIKKRAAWRPVEHEDILALVQISYRGQPFTDDEIQHMGAAYDRHVEVATLLLENRGRPGLEGGEGDDEVEPDVDVDDDHFQNPKEMVLSFAIRPLGLLRPQNPHVVAQLIEVICESLADEDSYDESTALPDAATALGHIGAAAVEPCILFLRYSNKHQPRFWVAEALGMAGRNNEEAFQTLLALVHDTQQENGKVTMTCALAKLHDDRAIPIVADLLQAISAPDAAKLDEFYEDIFLLEQDQFELMDALHELNAIEALDPEPNPERYLDDENDTSGAVIVRGYGRIAQAVPANWDYPDKRAAADDEDDFEDEDYDDDGDETDPPFLFTPPPKLQPIVNTNKVGRNEPCPCGSGKKYKHCHGKDG